MLGIIIIIAMRHSHFLIVLFVSLTFYANSGTANGGGKKVCRKGDGTMCSTPGAAFLCSVFAFMRNDCPKLCGHCVDATTTTATTTTTLSSSTTTAAPETTEQPPSTTATTTTSTETTTTTTTFEITTAEIPTTTEEEATATTATTTTDDDDGSNTTNVTTTTTATNSSTTSSSSSSVGDQVKPTSCTMLLLAILLTFSFASSFDMSQ